jgi:hypothetical protein
MKTISAETRKKLSIAMKAQWARRREMQIARERPSLSCFYEALEALGGDNGSLAQALLSEVSTKDLVAALDDYDGAGTKLHDRIRNVLTTRIEEIIQNA